MTDNRDDAEFLDGDALGEEIGDDSLPGTRDYPPDRPWGADDPTADDIDDDVATRDKRLDHQAGHRDAFTLVADGSSEGLADDESQEIAAAVDATDGDVSPEEGALHILDDDEVG
jgi:hypothetical protein